MLLAPIALLLSALAVPIILLYIIKLRRQVQVVPSTFLWRHVVEDLQANAPWQRLRFNLLLLLQLLALAALILSLARPAYSRSHVIAGDLVVIVDQSYGMQAHDVKPSRFALALARARTLATELGNTSVMSVIGMSAEPHLAIADSTDQGAIRQAIASLHVGVDQPNFLDALSLAASLARGGRDTRVIVLTSRDSGIAGLPLTVSFPVDIERIGGTLHDLGITAFSASPQASTVQAVARVSNFGDQTARSDLELVADGRLFDVRPLAIGGHHQQNLVWTDLPLGVRRLQVHLTHSDDVAGDKSAWAAVPAAFRRRVLLVSSGDFFLEAALADDPSVQLSVVSPAAYQSGMERGFDLVILDGALPSRFPRVATLIVSPAKGTLGALRFGGNLPGGAVQASAVYQGSLLKYVDLSDVHVAQVRAVSLPAWLEPVATAAGRTVLAAGQQGNTRLGLIDFDLQHSDWPLRVSFPIMLDNLLQYVAPGLTLGETTITTGSAVQLFAPPGARRLEVTRPGGAVTMIKPPFPPFTDTTQPGLYSVKAIGGLQSGGSGSSAAGPPQPFAVNFFPTRPAPVAGPGTLHLGHVQAGKPLTASIPVEIAWPFELLALLILAAEWWIAFRGLRLP